MCSQCSRYWNLSPEPETEKGLVKSGRNQLTLYIQNSSTDKNVLGKAIIRRRSFIGGTIKKSTNACGLLNFYDWIIIQPLLQIQHRHVGRCQNL